MFSIDQLVTSFNQMMQNDKEVEKELDKQLGIMKAIRTAVPLFALRGDVVKNDPKLKEMIKFTKYKYLTYFGLSCLSVFALRFIKFRKIELAAFAWYLRFPIKVTVFCTAISLPYSLDKSYKANSNTLFFKFLKELKPLDETMINPQAFPNSELKMKNTLNTNQTGLK